MTGHERAGIQTGSKHEAISESRWGTHRVWGVRDAGATRLNARLRSHAGRSLVASVALEHEAGVRLAIVVDGLVPVLEALGDSETPRF